MTVREYLEKCIDRQEETVYAAKQNRKRSKGISEKINASKHLEYERSKLYNYKQLNRDLPRIILNAEVQKGDVDI